MQRQRIAYGPDPSQYGDLYVPDGRRHSGTVVIVHGGFWRWQYDNSLGAPLAADLAEHGYVAWNIEYRRVGNGGGWPHTFHDVAAAIDHLESCEVDSSAVVVIGHSAGGHLAVWAAARRNPVVQVSGVVSQAGVLDLATAARNGIGAAAVAGLLGGSMTEMPERYRDADPIQQVPVDAPVLCVHARDDDTVPFAQSSAYVAAAIVAGGSAALHEVPGDHFSVIDPADEAWAAVRAALPDLLTGHLPN